MQITNILSDTNIFTLLQYIHSPSYMYKKSIKLFKECQFKLLFLTSNS